MTPRPLGVDLVFPWHLYRWRNLGAGTFSKRRRDSRSCPTEKLPSTGVVRTSPHIFRPGIAFCLWLPHGVGIAFCLWLPHGVGTQQHSAVWTLTSICLGCRTGNWSAASRFSAIIDRWSSKSAPATRPNGVCVRREGPRSAAFVPLPPTPPPLCCVPPSFFVTQYPPPGWISYTIYSIYIQVYTATREEISFWAHTKER